MADIYVINHGASVTSMSTGSRSAASLKSVSLDCRLLKRALSRPLRISSHVVEERGRERRHRLRQERRQQTSVAGSRNKANAPNKYAEKETPVGKTWNEFKAEKKNRQEDVKLTTVVTQITRQRRLSEKEYSEERRLLTGRSERLLRRHTVDIPQTDLIRSVSWQDFRNTSTSTSPPVVGILKHTDGINGSTPSSDSKPQTCKRKCVQVTDRVEVCTSPREHHNHSASDDDTSGHCQCDACVELNKFMEDYRIQQEQERLVQQQTQQQQAQLQQAQQQHQTTDILLPATASQSVEDAAGNSNTIVARVNGEDYKSNFVTAVHGGGTLPLIRPCQTPSSPVRGSNGVSKNTVACVNVPKPLPSNGVPQLCRNSTAPLLANTGRHTPCDISLQNDSATARQDGIPNVSSQSLSTSEVTNTDYGTVPSSPDKPHPPLSLLMRVRSRESVVQSAVHERVQRFLDDQSEFNTRNPIPPGVQSSTEQVYLSKNPSARLSRSAMMTKTLGALGLRRDHLLLTRHRSGLLRQKPTCTLSASTL